MTRYIATRLGYGAIAVIGVVLVVFVVVRLLGDPAALMLSEDAPPQAIEAFRIEHGFDKPIHIQLIRYLGDLARGDLGKSLRHNESASRLILERIPATLQLTVAALVVSLLISIPLGTIAALNKGTMRDRATMVIAIAGQSLPDFWLALMLMLVFGVWLKWVPVSGMGSWKHLVLPVISLAVFPLARATRLVRSSLLETLNQDYIKTARSKGLSSLTTVGKHALRNALIPVVTIVGLEVGSLLGGAIIIETIFAWPGMGRLLVQALNNRDFPLIQAGVLMLAVIKVIVTVMVDVAYTFIDPRIRYA